MIANYHTHTFRCHHATGTEREYIETSIKSGIKILGFSEHAPYNDQSYRLQLADIPDYFNTLTALKKEYEKDIEIHIGYEIEYYPLFDKEMMKIVHKYPAEYLILGQHHLYSGIGTMWVWRGISEVKDLKDYTSSIIKAFSLNRYTYLAHPDLIDFKGDKTAYFEEMEKMCVAAKEKDIPLEFNMYGFRDNRQYPNSDFWDIAKSVGNKCIIGLDSHSADYAGTYMVDKAYEWLNKKGITVIDTVKLKKP